MTRREARERFNLITTVYRRGYIPFVDPGEIKLLVRCIDGLVRRESDWIPHEQASEVFDKLVFLAVTDRMNLPQPPKPYRFHQPHDY